MRDTIMNLNISEEIKEFGLIDSKVLVDGDEYNRQFWNETL